MRTLSLTLIALLAGACCRSEADRSSVPSGRTDPGATESAATASASAAAKPPPAPTGADGLPLDIPTTRTPAPSATDWAAAAALRIPSARPLGCEVNMIREWVRVSCGKRRGGAPPVDVKPLNGCSRDTYTAIRSNASLVTAIAPGTRCEVEFSWADSRELFAVEWTRGSRPAMDFHTQVAPPAPPASVIRGRPVRVPR